MQNYILPMYAGRILESNIYTKPSSITRGENEGLEKQVNRWRKWVYKVSKVNEFTRLNKRTFYIIYFKYFIYFFLPFLTNTSIFYR